MGLLVPLGVRRRSFSGRCGEFMATRIYLPSLSPTILRDQVAHCVEHAIASGNKTDQRKKIAELMEVIGRADA